MRFSSPVAELSTARCLFKSEVPLPVLALKINRLLPVMGWCKGKGKGKGPPGAESWALGHLGTSQIFFPRNFTSRTSSATDPYTRWLGAPGYATTNHRQPVPNYTPHCAVAAGRGRGSPHAFWPQGYSRGPKPWVSARLQAASLSPLGCADMRETQRVQGAGGGYVAPIAPEGSAGVQGGVGYSPRRGAPPCPTAAAHLRGFLAIRYVALLRWRSVALRAAAATDARVARECTAAGGGAEQEGPAPIASARLCTVSVDSEGIKPSSAAASTAPGSRESAPAKQVKSRRGRCVRKR